MGGPMVAGGTVLRRDLILARAAELFAGRGYAATSLSDLAGASGVAKATLFHYFSSKQEILYELYSRAMDMALDRIRAAERRGRDAADNVREMIREHVLLILENRELFKVLFDEEDELSPAQLGVIRRQQGRYVHFIGAQLERLRADGRLHPGLPPTIAVQGLLGMASWVYRWYEPERARDAASIADVLSELGMHGVIK